MLHLLLVVIFLLEIRLNSSASVMEMMMLTPKASSVRTAAGNLTNFATTVTGTLLTGYFANIQYTDATCSIVRFAENYPLNECFPWSDGLSIKVSTNGTHFAINFFFDYSCTKTLRSALLPLQLRVCNTLYVTNSVTSSYLTIASSAALLSTE